MTGLTDVPTRYCPVCDSVAGATFAPGPGGRPDAACPKCGSLERHRFLAILLAAMQPTLGTIDVLLDVAPSPQVTPLLGRLGATHHVRIDLGADNRLVDVLGSLTDLPTASRSVDLMVCYHVLEHVPDDRSAMREIARVLRPGGLVLLQVPWRPGTPTDEDPDAPVEIRLARFGQADHVRYYGDDFEDRLVESGLSLRRITPRALLGTAMCTWFKLAPDETVWLATPSTSPALPSADDVVPTSLTRALDALAAQIADQQAGRARAERKAADLSAQLRQLRARRPSARVAARLPDPVKARLRPLVRAARARATAKTDHAGAS